MTLRTGVSALLTAALPCGLVAQEPPERGWSWSAQLTTVWVSGNSESSTFGLGSTLRRAAERNELKFEAGAIRTDAALKTRRAVGTAASFEIEEEEDNRKTAEAYFTRARYDRTIGSGLVWFGGADWQRNTFAGIDSRLLFASGVGRVWADQENFRLKTDLSATYTFEQHVVENPAAPNSFAGLRYSADLMRRLTSTTIWESSLISDLNVEDTEDVRLDFTNALPIAISTRLSLKPSLQLLWYNRPAFTNVELFTAGVPTGEEVQVPLEKLDTFFKLALVVSL